MKRLFDEYGKKIDYDYLFVSEVINRYCCSKCDAEDNVKNTRKDYLSVKQQNESIEEAIKKSLKLTSDLEKKCKICSKQCTIKILSSFKKLPKIMIIKKEEDQIISRVKIATIIDFKNFVDQSVAKTSTIYN